LLFPSLFFLFLLSLGFVIKTADWIIDLGPEGGSQGGQLIANGSPEKVAKDKKSFTGKYLKEMIN
jgi:excinuclease ABC subunit A